jgi:hypothetical protein
MRIHFNSSASNIPISESLPGSYRPDSLVIQVVEPNPWLQKEQFEVRSGQSDPVAGRPRLILHCPATVSTVVVDWNTGAGITTDTSVARSHFIALQLTGTSGSCTSWVARGVVSHNLLRTRTRLKRINCHAYQTEYK